MMPRHALRIACGFLLVVSSASAQEYGETVEVNVVTVDVEVRDRQGRPVTDLGRDDFRLFENGRRVELTNFERVSRRAPPSPAAIAPGAPATAPVPTPHAADANSHVVVYVDNVHLRAASRTRALRQVRDFLAQGLAGERVLIAAQGKGGFSVRLPFSNDPAAVAAALNAVDKLSAYGHEVDLARVSAVQALVAIQKQNIVQGSACSHNLLDPVDGFARSTRDNTRATLGQLAFLVNSLAGLPGRKALLYVSDGLPMQPGQELFEVLYQICGGGAVMSGVGFTSQPDSGGERKVFETDEPGVLDDGGERAVWKPSEGGFGFPMLDTSGDPRTYQAQSAALDAARYDLTNDLRRLAAHASAHRVSLYTLQASGLSAAIGEGTRGGDEGLLAIPAVASATAANVKDPLVYLAHETGGRAIIDTNDFRRDLARMREGLATYYSLGYSPRHHGDGKEHRIEVKVKRPGVRLAYQRNYRDKPVLEQAADRVLATLIHGYEDNPLGIAVEVLPPQPLDRERLLVTARLLVPLAKLATINREHVYEGKLRVLVMIGEPGGGRSELRQLEVPLRVPETSVLTARKRLAYDVRLALGKGEHLLALGVRDELGGTTSYLRLTVHLPAHAGEPPAGR